MNQERSFTAEVKISGINPYVDVPDPVVKALGGGPKARVLVKVQRADVKEKGVKTLSPEKKLAKDDSRLKPLDGSRPEAFFARPSSRYDRSPRGCISIGGCEIWLNSRWGSWPILP